MLAKSGEEQSRGALDILLERHAGAQKSFTVAKVSLERMPLALTLPCLAVKGCASAASSGQVRFFRGREGGHSPGRHQPLRQRNAFPFDAPDTGEPGHQPSSGGFH